MVRSMDDAGVAEVIGTVLTVGITVGLVVGLAFVLTAFPPELDPVSADVKITSTAGQISARHAGGEAVPERHGTFIFEVDGSTEARPLSAFSANYSDGRADLWEIGERLCLSCPFHGQTITRVSFVARERLAGEWTGSVLATPGPGPGPGPGAVFVSCPLTAVEGSVLDCAAARSATDGGAASTLSEEGVTSQSTGTHSADATVDAGDFSDPDNAFADDGSYATTSTSNPAAVRYGYADPGAGGAVLGVTLKAEVEITTWNNDAWRLQVCKQGGACSAESGQLGAQSGVNVIQYNVTTLEPDDGLWSAAELDQLEARVIPVQNTGGGAPRDGTWRIDHAWFEATTLTTTSFDMEIRGGFSGVPTGTNTLEVRYQVVDASEDFRLDVGDGAGGWNPVATLDATSMTTVTHVLTAAEYDGGSPQIRFVDLSPGDGSLTSLLVDYARIVTT